MQIKIELFSNCHHAVCCAVRKDDLKRMSSHSSCMCTPAYWGEREAKRSCLSLRPHFSFPFPSPRSEFIRAKDEHSHSLLAVSLPSPTGLWLTGRQAGRRACIARYCWTLISLGLMRFTRLEAKKRQSWQCCQNERILLFIMIVEFCFCRLSSSPCPLYNSLSFLFFLLLHFWAREGSFSGPALDDGGSSFFS